MIEKQIVLAISILLVLTLVPETYAQKGSFIVEVTFIDSLRNGSNYASVYI